MAKMVHNLCDFYIALYGSFMVLQARGIAVPTDDAMVKARLRELGHPICKSYLAWKRVFAGNLCYFKAIFVFFCEIIYVIIYI